jgi:16S rRNA (guanine527-N7)-methyltransferase
MTASGFVTRLLDRAAQTGTVISEPQALQLERYYELLRRWNRRMNLTALPLDASPSNETLDRLFLEPFAAAAFIEDEPIACVDLGSGGGSPAIPLKIARGQLVLTMVEARERKSAFLREVVRHLGLTNVTTLTGRAETLATPNLADLVTLRAIRLDQALVTSIRALLKSTGRLITFGVVAVPDGFTVAQQGRLQDSPFVVNILRSSDPWQALSR